MDASRLHDDDYRREVIDTLWREHNLEIRRFCMAWLGSGLAEEITQEVFVAAWQGLAKFKLEASIRAWLFGIARLKCQQTYRNHKRRATIAQTFLEEIREQVHAEETTSPEQISTQTNEVKHLHDRLAKLSEHDRILLNLRYWRAHSIQDIASIMGKSAPTIRKRIVQAEQRLKEYMQDDASRSIR